MNIDFDFFNIHSKKFFGTTFSYKNKANYLFMSYILLVGGMALSSIILNITDYLLTNYLSAISILDLFEISRERIDNYPFYIVVLVAPLFEELLFRLILVVNKLNFALFSALLIYFLIGGKTIAFDYTVSESYLLVLVSLFVFFLLFKTNTSSIVIFLRKHQMQLGYISILTFGLIHLSNIPIADYLDKWYIFMFPIYVLPYFFMGYFFVNIRLKLGFAYALVLHVIINLVPTLIFLLKST